MTEGSEIAEFLEVNFTYKRKHKLDEFSETLQVKEKHFQDIISKILETQKEIQKTKQKPELKGSKKLPGLAIAVVGDSESFVPKPWNTTAFTTGLLETVKGAKESWIIYRGRNDGISELIHRAFMDDIGNNQSNQKPSLIALRPTSQKSDYKQGNELLVHLEPKFSKQQEVHKEYKWFNTYLTQFLSHLSKQFTTLLSKKADNNELTDLLEMRVPVLLVVAEGDVGTIHQVKSAVTSNVPVLLVKGSGKATNFMADYLKEPLPSEREKMMIETAPLLLGIYFRRQVFEKLKKMMSRIVEYHYLITVFDIENKNGAKMEDVVVEAIIKGWSLEELINKGKSDDDLSSSTMTMTKLKRRHVLKTITSNVVTGEVKSLMEGEGFQMKFIPGSLSLYFYMAYQYIQENITDNKQSDLELLLLEALIANKVDYVSAMLQSGIKFNSHHKERLFNDTLKCKVGCDGKDCRNIHAIHIRVLKKSGRRIWCTCKTNCKVQNDDSAIRTDGKPARPLSSHSFASSINKTHPEETEQNIKPCTCKCLRYHKIKDHDKDSFSEAKYLCQELLNYPNLVVATKKDSKRESFRERKGEFMLVGKGNLREIEQTALQGLLAWALFANRRELAGIFWTKCSSQLLTGVMASSILKSMADKVESTKDRKLHEDLLQHSRIFENRVIEMLTALYEEKETEVMSHMFHEHTVWGIKVSPVACAYDNRLMDVIGEPCVQRKLNKIWYNESAVKLTDWVQSMFGLNGCCNMCKAWCSPIATFAFHYMFVLAVMFVFSAFILTNIRIISSIKDIGGYEWCLYIWLVGDIVEEVPRNIVIALNNKQRGHLTYRIKEYFSNFWNWVTVLSYLTICSGIVMRTMGSTVDERFLLRLYSLGLSLMYMRFLQSMLVVNYLGPKIIMILKMLRELVNIGWLLLVFIACTGVLYHANMYPNHWDMWSTHGPSYWRIWKIISLPYWQIYGELFLDEIRGDNNSNDTCTFVRQEWERNPEIDRCVEYDWSLNVIAAFHMLITNLLLVNLLIALFSYRFKEVQRNSDRLWKYNRYAVITDYMTRFPVPFNLLIRIPYLIYGLVKQKITLKNQLPIGCGCMQATTCGADYTMSYSSATSNNTAEKTKSDDKNDDNLEKLQYLHAVKCFYNELATKP